jgi:hypothetical protein
VLKKNKFFAGKLKVNDENSRIRIHPKMSWIRNTDCKHKVKLQRMVARVYELPVEQGARGWSDILLPDGDPSPSEQQQSFQAVPLKALVRPLYQTSATAAFFLKIQLSDYSD